MPSKLTETSPQAKLAGPLTALPTSSAPQPNTGSTPGAPRSFGRAQEGLPHHVVVEVRERLPHHRRRAGDLRRGEGGALDDVVGRVGRAAVVSLSRTITSPGAAEAVVHGHAAAHWSSWPAASGWLLSSAATASQPLSRSGARLGSAAMVAGLGLAVVAGGEHHQAAPVDRRTSGRRRRRPGAGLPLAVQVRPPQELFMTFTPALIRSLLTWVERRRRPGCHGQRGRGTVVGWRVVVDDARRNEVGVGGDAARELVEGRPAAICDTQVPCPTDVIDAGVVAAGCDVDQFLEDPPLERRVVAHDARIDDADDNALTGVSRIMRCIGIGQRLHPPVDPRRPRGRRRRGRGGPEVVARAKARVPVRAWRSDAHCPRHRRMRKDSTPRPGRWPHSAVAMER